MTLAQEILTCIDQLKSDRDLASRVLANHLDDLTQEELDLVKKAGLVTVLETVVRRRD